MTKVVVASKSAGCRMHDRNPLPPKLRHHRRHVVSDEFTAAATQDHVQIGIHDLQCAIDEGCQAFLAAKNDLTIDQITANEGGTAKVATPLEPIVKSEPQMQLESTSWPRMDNRNCAFYGARSLLRAQSTKGPWLFD
jgi:hypothetical protein